MQTPVRELQLNETTIPTENNSRAFRDQVPASLLKLAPEVRLLIYSYLGPTDVSQGVQINMNDSYVTRPAPAARALASLSQTCRTVRGEVTDLLDTMRTPTVVLGYESQEYHVPLPHD